MRSGRRAVIGLGLVVLGALLGMLAMTALPWYRSSFNGILANGSAASDIRSSIALYESQPEGLQSLFSLGVAPLYFRWLGVALLLVAALLGLVSSGLDAVRARVAGVASAVLAVAGLVLTGFAIRFVALDGSRLRRDVPGWGDFVAQSNVGAWAMVLGFVLVGVGALLAAGSREQLHELLSDDEPTDAGTRVSLVKAQQPRRDDDW